MKKILFRADAAPHIGIGDLMSLINISKYFDDTYEKYFLIRGYKAGIDLVEKYQVENCFIIDTSYSLKQEVKYINNLIDEIKIDIIFFEITEKKLSDYTGINKEVKKVCVNFDGHILDDLDLVIDWDVEARKYFDTANHIKTKFLFGPKYVILPKEFYSNEVLHRKNELNKNKVLIAMGGADELDFTGKVVDSIIKLKIDIELNIIVGSGYEYKDNLQRKLSNTNIKYQIKQNVINMLDEYLSCDIGIGAGGLTSSELVATKVSAILIATYEHQIARCKYFDDMDWANYLGYRDYSDSDFKKAIINPIKVDDTNVFETHKIVESIDELF